MSKTLKQDPSPFSILYFNARSLFPKLDELRVLCLTHQHHIICIVETWLDNTIQDDELSLNNNYVLYRRDRDRHGGGVLMYVLDSLSSSIVYSGPIDLELIVISIDIHPSRVALSLYYRPPNSPVSVFESLISTLYSTVDNSLFSNFILLL